MITLTSDNIKRLSLYITIIFQIIPRVMPALVPEQNLREKFDNDDYAKEIENMFREKFLQNLEVSCQVPQTTFFHLKNGLGYQNFTTSMSRKY